MKKIFFLAFLFLLSSLAFAATINFKEPVSKKLAAFESIDLGIVGPGQKLEVVAERPAGEQSKNVEAKAEGLWDQVIVESLPDGWKAEESKIFEANMKAFITLPKDAADGDYTFNLKALDEYDGLQPLTVKATVKVSRDRINAQVQNAHVTAGTNQPAVFYIKLRNKSSASDVFEIKASGLPSQWKYTKQVFLRYNSEEIIPYEVVGTEQGDYNVELTVKSLSSDLINAKQTVKLSTRSSITLDMQAASHGILLFPTVEQTIYSLMALISFFTN